MRDILRAIQLVLDDVRRLGVPATATAAAGVLVPLIAAVAGLDVTAAELAGWLIAAGGVAATLEKLTVVKGAKSAVNRKAR